MRKRVRPTLLKNGARFVLWVCTRVEHRAERMRKVEIAKMAMVPFH